MTEQQHQRAPANRPATPIQGSVAQPETPILTARDEHNLLDEANSAAPPTLAPSTPSTTATAYVDRPAMPRGLAAFGGDALDVVRRHPLPALLCAAGLAYLLTRRRSQ